MSGKLCLLLLVIATGPPFVQADAIIISTSVDLTVNQDGSVSLFYELELSDPQDAAPVAWIPVSFPSSNFQIEQVHASRCDPRTLQPLEEGAVIQVEREGREEIPLEVRRHPDPRAESDVIVELGDHAIPPGQSGSVCVSAVIPDYMSHDLHCPESAYVYIRPTLYYGNAGQPAELFAAIHLPPDVNPKAVLAQQEWPRERIQPSIPVQEENGQAVVRWHSKDLLSEVHWIAAIFPAGKIKLKKAFDGLQTDYRLVPLEILNLDAYVQNDTKVRLVYELEIDNTGGCKPIDTVQFVLPGRFESLNGKVDGKPVSVHPSSSIYDDLKPYIGNNWYQPVEASLGSSRILPQQSAKVQLETVVNDEIDLLNPEQGTVSLIINPTASASGVWRQGSRWTTRIHLPSGISESDVQPITSKFTSKESAGGHVVVSWEQTTQPSPVDVSFPIGRMQDVQWSIEDPEQGLFVLKNYQQFPATRNIFLTVTAPIVLFLAVWILLRAWRKS